MFYKVYIVNLMCSILLYFDILVDIFLLTTFEQVACTNRSLLSTLILFVLYFNNYLGIFSPTYMIILQILSSSL